ncbi:cation diffusion facilitator family transporter [Candidatus Saccharibacteria bacterium]|nr:cation diffusion facilitator family transporter [Candidatus Saccharibacteria bacterium]
MKSKPKRRNKPGNKSSEQIVFISFLTNISDIFLNLIVGLITGSVSVLAQSLQGLADLTTSGTLILGVRRSQKHANEDYPFGYGREVFFWVLISAMFMLIVTGGASIYLGVNRILNPSPLSEDWLAVIALTVAIFTNGYAFSLSYKGLKKSERRASILDGIKNSSLLELKAAFLIDGAGLLAAVLGLVAVIASEISGSGVFDALGSIMVGLIMVVFAVLLIKDVKNFLVGKSASKRIKGQIVKAAISVKGVQDVLDLRTMFLGSDRLLVVIELHIDERLKTKSIEMLSDEVKAVIKKRVPRVEIVQVEVETPDHELV